MGKKRGPRFGAHALKTMDLSNKVFEEYYKHQLQLDDADFAKFMTTFREDLPVTFRLTGFRQQTRELLSLLKDNYLHDLMNKPHQNSLASENFNFSVNALPWYPDEMAWQINASRLAVRKNPELKVFKRFLVSESESGNLSRQEAVSMLPPLVLDIKQHHSVLDLCAAPGSKSAQLVELLHADAERLPHDHGYAEPSGIVVANDFDRKRCYLMIHQVKRLQSPCVILTVEDASIFPRMFVDSPENPSEKKQLLFDRILADVPCSGDGTMRKSPDIWLRWTPKIGRGHHDLQKRILRRGLELLKVPESPNSVDLPRLVYSTCSLNPMEDESVIAAVLQAAKGSVRLVEPDLMTIAEKCTRGTFKARPGLKSWRVMLGNDKWYSSREEIPENERGNVQASLFPPANVEELHLERCRRVLPHDQDTGAFFIAVMEKVADLPWMNSKTKVAAKSSKNTNEEATVYKTKLADVVNEPEEKRARLSRAESEFVFLDPSQDQEWPTIREYYGIRDQTGDKSSVTVEGRSTTSCILNSNQILYRASVAGDPVRRRNLYYTNKLVKRVMEANYQTGLHIVSGGVKLFAICDDKQFTGYRVLHDGVHLANAFLPTFNDTGSIMACGRRIYLTYKNKADLILLLQEEMPLAERFSSETQKQWEALSVGPVLIDYKPSNSAVADVLPRCQISFAGWRGTKSLRHYIDRHERVHIIRLCGLDCSIPMVMGKSEEEAAKMRAEEDNAAAVTT